MDNYNYPLGADTPSAPWNQTEPEPKEFKCDVWVTLKKREVIESTCYWEEKGEDEDGNYYHSLSISDEELEADYKNGNIQLTEMLEELAKYLKADLDSCPKQRGAMHKRWMLEQCQGWTVEDIQIEQP